MSNEIDNGEKKQHTEWDKIFISHQSDRGLVVSKHKKNSKN